MRDPRYLGEGESRAPTLTRSDAVPPKPGTRNRAVGAQGGGRVVGNSGARVPVWKLSEIHRFSDSYYYAESSKLRRRRGSRDGRGGRRKGDTRRERNRQDRARSIYAARRTLCPFSLVGSRERYAAVRTIQPWPTDSLGRSSTNGARAEPPNHALRRRRRRRVEQACARLPHSAMPRIACPAAGSQATHTRRAPGVRASHRRVMVCRTPPRQYQLPPASSPAATQHHPASARARPSASLPPAPSTRPPTRSRQAERLDPRALRLAEPPA